MCGAMPFSSTSQFSIGAAAEALFGPLDHGLCRADLGLADGAGCFNINDDAELHVDEVVVGVSEESRSLVRAGPLRRRIGWREKLRDHIAGGTPGRIIMGCQILLHCAAGPLR